MSQFPATLCLDVHLAHELPRPHVLFLQMLQLSASRHLEQLWWKQILQQHQEVFAYPGELIPWEETPIASQNRIEFCMSVEVE